MYNTENIDEFIIFGRNAVLEAIRADKTIDRIYIQEEIEKDSLKTIIEKAKKRNIIVDFVNRERLNKLSNKGKHQGVVAKLAAYEYSTLEEILETAKNKETPPFVIILDGIEDPHNLGAIIRTAHQAGADGIIIPKRNSVGLNATVVKASAGAINYLKVARVTNLSRTIEELKKEGFWFACADMTGQTMYDTDLTGAIALVLGSEGDGVSNLVKEKCDFVVKIPVFGKIDSLNVSVATGILAYEVVRQRLLQGKK